MKFGDVTEPFIKICGVRGGEDVQTAVEGGANALGVVLTKSPRQISVEQARNVAEQVVDRALVVGVFYGESVTEIKDAATAVGLSAIQVHGNYSKEDFAQLRETGLPLIRAVNVEAPELSVGAYGDDVMIIDALKPGSGKEWDYRSLRDKHVSGNWLLAGGLSVDNVAQALKESGAWGVDVSSGVELKRGYKSPELIERFINIVRNIK